MPALRNWYVAWIRLFIYVKSKILHDVLYANPSLCVTWSLFRSKRLVGLLWNFQYKLSIFWATLRSNKKCRIPYGSKDIPTNLWGNGSKLIKIWNNFVRDFVGVCNILKEGKHVIQQLNSWTFKRCILRYKEVIKYSLNPKSLRYAESRPAVHDLAKNCILFLSSRQQNKRFSI